MSEKKAYLKLTPVSPDPMALNDAAAREYIKEQVGYQELAGLIKDIQDLGEGFYKGWSYGFGLIPDDQPTELDKEIWTDRLKTGLEGFLLEIYDDIIPLIPDHTIEIELTYDPSEWFTTERSRWGTHAAGRLYSLARIGALQVMGFRVEGTGLPTAEDDE